MQKEERDFDRANQRKKFGKKLSKILQSKAGPSRERKEIGKRDKSAPSFRAEPTELV